MIRTSILSSNIWILIFTLLSARATFSKKNIKNISSIKLSKPFTIYTTQISSIGTSSHPMY